MQNRKTKRTSSTSPSGSKALAIGTFDGVHRGHQSLLQTATRVAENLGVKSAAYTYRLPPKMYLYDQGPYLLIEPEKKIELLKEFVDQVIVGDFLKVKDLTPEEFVEEVLVENLNASAVVVGSDWEFGRNRSGSVKDLEQLSGGRFTVHSKEQLEKDGRPISSTWIRRSLRKGDIQTARGLLGRYPEFSGQVVKGNRVGTQIGFPTANLQLDQRMLLPRKGSYAGFAYLDRKQEYKAVAYIGDKPTVSKNRSSGLEVHLFNWDGELYGKEVRVKLVKFLGESRKYGDTNKLRKAIGDYAERARKVLYNIDWKQQR